jgi:lipase chaperone LimK
MAVTPRVHGVAEQEALAVHERYPGYRAELVKALDDVIAQQAQAQTARRREDTTKVVDALGRSAVAKAGER